MRAGLYAVKVGAATFGGITATNLPMDTQLGGEAASGELYRRILYIMSQGHQPSFTTLSIATALAATGGMAVDVAGLSGGLVFYAQKYKDGGSREATGHRSYAFTKGLLFPQTLSCDHRGDATLAYGANLVSTDGATSPLVVTDSATLPSLANQTERYSLGKVTIGAIDLTAENELQSIQLAFGVSVVAEGGVSNVYDTLSYVVSWAPVLTLTGRNPEWVKSTLIPLFGKTATHANTTIYLRKRAAGGTFVADGTAEHVKITAAGLAIPEDIFNASGMDRGTTSVRLETLYDGTNAPIIINTASAIT
jgi:hypothetical protein